MTSQPLVAGVDAGGSHTEIVLLDTAGRERLRLRGPGSIVRPGDEATSAALIGGLLREAAQRAEHSDITALVVGAAGAGRPEIRARLAALLRAEGAPDRTQVVPDAETAYVSVLSHDPGILLLSGTGSIALARDAAGAWHRAGGLGWRFGDEGSGFAIGSAGIRAAGQAAELRGPHTALTTLLPEAAGVSDALALVRWGNGADPGAVAALGPAVQLAARRGDPVAATIVRQAAEGLIAHVTALLRHFGDEGTVALVLGGGALRPGTHLRDAVVAIARRTPPLAVRDQVPDAARGAALAALRLETAC